jgi:transposase
MNRLKVKEQDTIRALYEKGWSIRKIARDLEIDRVTVRRYAKAAGAKSPTPQTGSAEQEDSKSPGVQTGSGSGSSSLCARWQGQIQEALEAGLSVQRIYQDLVSEHDFGGSYYSVRRFVLRLAPAGERLPFRRMECQPGEELQVDFGQGAWVVDAQGKRRKTHLFRCVLSCSRRGYTEAVWRQDSRKWCQVF